jgi:hypothetical protein
VNASAGRGVHAPVIGATIPDDVLSRAAQDVASQEPADGPRSPETPI